MDLLNQFSEFCKIAIPFLGMIYAAILIYSDAPKDRWVYVKQGVTLIFFAVLAYLRVWG